MKCSDRLLNTIFRSNLVADRSYPLLHCLSSDPEAVAWIIAGTLTFYYLVMELLHGKNVLTMTSDRLVEALIELLFGDRK